MRRPTPGWGVRGTLRRPRAAAGVAACTTALALACTPEAGRDRAGAPPPPATEARSSSVATCPLTGLPAPEQPLRPGVAVVVADSPPARPQAGLDRADVVFQEPVEGGGAWFLAIFQCAEAAEVGPVRDPHLVDASILAQYRPVLLAFAGDRPLPPPLASAGPGIESYDARSSASASAFHRDRNRRPPHNLFTSTEKLRALSSATGSPPPLEFATPSPAPPGRGAAATPGASSPSGSAGRTVTLAYSDETTRYVYDPEAGNYRRFVGSEPHVVKDGSQIRVTNVVVLWVKVGEVEPRDPAGNRAPDARLEGEGDALLLQGGVERSGRWRREAGDGRLELVDRRGSPLTLAPGNSWVHLLPDTRAAYVG